jgi:hypothetical protein
VREALIVHHMGPTGERSRGDSRIIDWPDATWKLVRENPEDENSQRYFSAYCRDVYQSESLLEFDPKTRRLTLRGGTRKDTANDRLIEPLLELLRAKPDSLSGRQIDDEMAAAGHGRNPSRKAREHAVKHKLVITSPGEKRAIIHKVNPDPPASAPVRSGAPLVRRNTESECASALIERTAHPPLRAQ